MSRVQPGGGPKAICAEALGRASAQIGGAQARNRTTDTRIFSPLLYRLSYLGTPGSSVIAQG